ncbi:pimeloyl-ACP methyl ester carboxylesterase [Caulobacter rhizosphaerae]|jgi:pimeloyl-ACP methyl ester carboxylesterase|uniref:Pimeloyl-ACP methyl ester carboxylesterase n=1 Tax=Caulobacter rhizosphaerae TaxID=2010972 RepID=A0ABU1MY81_9CAUL|nr:alpha/beta hydrolase [Caulobacter rhizosphaerae]MDR6531144.1 pimeloyl-ACP methyl ester carboxylesterase [Caulobacter rhizosphaerae]
MRTLLKIMGLTAALATASVAQSAEPAAKPTIVLVHGAFADASGWNGVVAKLSQDGYPVVAAANPLRALKSDAESLSALIRSIGGSVVLVGHSYGGEVITEAAKGQGNVVALVYVAGFLPDAGESALSLSGKFPGSTLAHTLAPVVLQDGDEDFYIQPAKFHAQFAADAPAATAALMAATQRPVTGRALSDMATAPTWKQLPSYVIYGTADRNIPAEAERFMADRAKARKTVAVEGGSHALMVSHPGEIVALIEEAASAR